MEHSLISDNIFFPFLDVILTIVATSQKIKQQHKFIYIGIPVAAFIWLTVYLSA